MGARRFPAGYGEWHSDANINYQLNRFLGGEPEAEVGALASRIRSFADWKREMLVAARGHEREGRRERAMSHYRAAEFFMTPGDPDKEHAYDRFIALFDELHGSELERVQVPYPAHPGKTLSALKLANPRAPVMVVHAGFDSFIEEFFGMGTFLRDRGFEVILFDGPGQGQPLVKQGLPMTHEWEKPVAAVLDHFRLDDVTLLGISLGGYLAPRAAAFEPRVRRVIAFDAMFDFFACATVHAGGLLRAVGRQLVGNPLTAAVVEHAIERMMAKDLTVDWGVRQGMHVTGKRTPVEFLDELRRYTLAEVADRIRQDFLLLAGAEDHHVPLEQFFLQARALTGVRSLTGRIFTREEQASSHCQFGNLDLALSTIADWTHERCRSV